MKCINYENELKNRHIEYSVLDKHNGVITRSLVELFALQMAYSCLERVRNDKRVNLPSLKGSYEYEDLEQDLADAAYQYDSIYSDTNEPKDVIFTEYYKSIVDNIAISNTLYTDNNGNIISIKRLSKNPFESLYDYFRDSKRMYYDILLDIYRGKCPYCNTGTDATALDHYLPKSIYPYFAICPINLVPICNYCNTVKSNKEFVDEDNTPFFHPYFYKWVSSIEWLEAYLYVKDVNGIRRVNDIDKELENTSSKLYSIVYGIKPLDCWPSNRNQPSYDFLKSNFNALRLGERYASYANRYMCQYKSYEIYDLSSGILSKVRERARLVWMNNPILANISFDDYWHAVDTNELAESIIIEYLKNERKITTEVYGLNHWKVALISLIIKDPRIITLFK